MGMVPGPVTDAGDGIGAPPSLPERVRRLLDEAARLRSLAEHTARSGDTGRLETSPRSATTDRRSQIGSQLLELLVDWRAAGGTLRLDPPPQAEASTRMTEQVRDAASRQVAGDPSALLQSVLDIIPFSEDDEIEVMRLHAAIRDSDRWRSLPRELQRGVVALCSARLRRLQDDRKLIHPRLEESFSMLTAFSKREQPGYVVGLSRHHKPVRNSWEEDARAWWERLRFPPASDIPASPPPNQEKLLTALMGALAEMESAPAEQGVAAAADVRRRVREALVGGVSPRDPRLVNLCAPVVHIFEGPELRNLVHAIQGEPDEPNVEEAPERDEVAVEWAWWGRTRARRAIVIGGEPRELSRQRIQRAFGFADLEWFPAEFRRNSLLTVRDRVRAGKVDLVILLGAFVGHDADEIILPACRERGVDCVYVEKGYSIGRVRAAIERTIDAVLA